MMLSRFEQQYEEMMSQENGDYDSVREAFGSIALTAESEAEYGFPDLPVASGEFWVVGQVCPWEYSPF